MLNSKLVFICYNAADGNIRIWKDYTLKGKQKLVTAFSSIQGHKPGVPSLNAVVDWQQQSGYLVYNSVNFLGVWIIFHAPMILNF